MFASHPVSFSAKTSGLFTPAAPSVPKARAGERGSSLIATAAFIVVLSGAVGLAFLATTNVGRNATRTKSLQAAIAVGDGYLESAFGQWRAKCRTLSGDPLPAGSFSLVAPSTVDLPQPNGYTI